jgi:4-hydroxy 2-oxovalerate aldolase
MQIAGRSEAEVIDAAKTASAYPIDVLYFADSMGSMTPTQTVEIIKWLRQEWSGPLGVHTHDNLGLALSNTLAAVDAGATWVDSTVTGMGRGPGNARTEELAIEVAELRNTQINMIPLMTLIRKTFKPMQQKYGWGTNPYYYLTGKYGIHPSYIQEMLNDSRYDEEDILAVIEHLRIVGGKKFSLNTLDSARNFYQGPAIGTWLPEKVLSGHDVMLLGAGPSVKSHSQAIESYIRKTKPIVIALNTQSAIRPELIDYRIACHPVRILADCHAHTDLPQPLIIPESMLPKNVKDALAEKTTLDFGLHVKSGHFDFGSTSCTTPCSLVLAYALAVMTSGKAERILMAGFDGYGADDPRSKETQAILDLYQSNPSSLQLLSVTPSRYALNIHSIYAM